MQLIARSIGMRSTGWKVTKKVKGEEIAMIYSSILRSRLGRFLSIDTRAASYPWNSPYAFAEIV